MTPEEMQKEIDRLTKRIKSLEGEIKTQTEHSRKLYLFIQKQQSELVEYHFESVKDCEPY